jgi:ATP-binding cassette, subfamily C (CFTR/MRP), member 1
MLNVGFTRPLQKDGKSPFMHGTCHAHSFEDVDLWQLPEAKHSGNLASRVEANFYARVPPGERPVLYRQASGIPSDDEKAGERDPNLSTEDIPAVPSTLNDDTKPGKPSLFARRGTGISPSKRYGNDKGAPYYDRSLAKALHATFWQRWWACGIARLISDTLKTTSPLVNKALLEWLAKVYVWHRLPDGAKAAFPVSHS